jgi:hypothetical protein
MIGVRNDAWRDHMYKVLGAVGATMMFTALALPGTAGAAQKQEPGVHKQVVGEEFSAQRRYRRRVYVRRYSRGYRYYRGYSPGYYGYYGGYSPGYYGYYSRPAVGVGIGPFGVWW